MMQRVARIHHERVLPMLAVPLLSPRLSSRWLALVTDVDVTTARNLVDSMSNEVIVHDDSITKVVPGKPMSYDDAVRLAYDQRAADSPRSMSDRRNRWTGHAVNVVRPVLIDKVDRDHRQSDEMFLRRRIVVAITLACGATLLALSFSVRQGDSAFYLLTFGLAATWTLGAFASGPLHLGHIHIRGVRRRPILDLDPGRASSWPQPSRSAADHPHHSGAGQHHRAGPGLRPSEQPGDRLRDHPGQRHRRGTVLPRRVRSPRSASAIRC